MPEPNGHVDLAGYLLEQLEGADRAHVERHLAGCEACRTEVRELEPTVRLLAFAAPAVDPPAGLEGRVFLAVERAALAEASAIEEARPRRRAWLGRRTGAFGALAVATAVVVALLAWPGGVPLELETTLAAPAGGSARADVEVRKTGIGRVITLRSDSLPILPKGEYYEVWFAAPGDSPSRPDRISAGTFHPDEAGRTSVRLAAAVDPALFPVVIVTAEPGDGDPGPSGREVLRSSR